MDKFRTDLGYAVGQIIEAKAIAYNIRGPSEISETSTGTVFV